MEADRASPNSGDHLSRYVREVHKSPMLSAEAEQTLSYRWRDHHDISAADQLVRSHLRLVVKIAIGYHRCGLPLEELISEGHVGLMRAVCRFDPDRGARFATCATWWVSAGIQEYVLRNWSMVKAGTTAAQEKLFFNLRRMRGRLEEFDHGLLRSGHIGKIADMRRVPEHEVINVDQRMAGRDYSLNAPVNAEGLVETLQHFH